MLVIIPFVMAGCLSAIKLVYPGDYGEEKAYDRATGQECDKVAETFDEDSIRTLYGHPCDVEIVVKKKFNRPEPYKKKMHPESLFTPYLGG